MKQYADYDKDNLDLHLTNSYELYTKKQIWHLTVSIGMLKQVTFEIN